MDELTKNIIDDFTAFLSAEIPKDKRYKSLQIGKWSLNNIKLTVKFFNGDKTGELFFDLREIKENRERFRHLLENALDQIKKIETIS